MASQVFILKKERVIYFYKVKYFYLNIVLTWKIVRVSEVSDLYIYIYIYIDEMGTNNICLQ